MLESESIATRCRWLLARAWGGWRASVLSAKVTKVLLACSSWTQLLMSFLDSWNSIRIWSLPIRKYQGCPVTAGMVKSPGHSGVHQPFARSPGHKSGFRPAAKSPGHQVDNQPSSRSPGHFSESKAAIESPGHLAELQSWYCSQQSCSSPPVIQLGIDQPVKVPWSHLSYSLTA